MDKDIPYIMEWMHDENITGCFKKDFSKYTRSEVENFILNSYTDTDQNFAITDNSDVYQGTISLKKINNTDRNAEYAIVMRRNAQHKGIATDATKQILSYAFNDLRLNKVYLNCLEENTGAVNFYKKCGFIYEGTLVGQWYIRDKFRNLCLYAVYNNTFINTFNITEPLKIMNFREKGIQKDIL